MQKIIIYFLITLLLLSCAVQAKSKKSKDSIPEWLNDPKSVYPEQLYLSAIGEGDSRSEAENYAAANLAKIFESKVKTDELINQRYQELITTDDFSYEDQTDVSKSVQINSEQTLFNIQFAESYTDKLGRVHVLAYLPRMKTGELYEEKILNNAERIAYFLKSKDQDDDVLVKYSAVSAAAAISANNEVLLDQLSIISPDTKEFIQLDYQHDQIMKEASRAAKDIKFKLNITNDTDNKIGIIMDEMFTDLGFVMAEPAIIKVDGEITFEETELARDDDYIFARYELQLKIRDPQDNIIAALSESGREGHNTYLEAKERAIRTLKKKIRNSLQKKILSYFNNLAC
ncbi:MAG: LPP20 family lipoprotein [Candidatus Cloacimonetes bacterium]|nr:LPP20 family lipoprotein [Candidatus Cloacimonadota bacterium]